MRALLDLPLRTPLSDRLMLVHHSGRKTGEHNRQPVSYVEHQGDLLSPGAAGRELVSDPDEVERLLGVMARANPSLRRFVRIPAHSDGRLDRAALEAAIEPGYFGDTLGRPGGQDMRTSGERNRSALFGAHRVSCPSHRCEYFHQPGVLRVNGPSIHASVSAAGSRDLTGMIETMG